MAKIIFLLDGKVIKESMLDKERFTIGRRISNDLHIDNLGISGKHAVIVTKDDGAYIEDLNSTNGTIVNSQKIKKHLLVDGDLIKLGKYKLRYLQNAVINKPQHQGFEDTVLVPHVDEVSIEPPEEKVKPTIVQESELMTEEVRPSLSSNVPAMQLPRLQILNGKDAGFILPLDKAVVKIGRPNEQLALVTKRSQGYFLSHVLGTDYPLINGQPLDTHAKSLSNHDEIEMLGVKMEFCLD